MLHKSAQRTNSVVVEVRPSSLTATTNTNHHNNDSDDIHMNNIGQQTHTNNNNNRRHPQQPTNHTKNVPHRGGGVIDHINQEQQQQRRGDGGSNATESTTDKWLRQLVSIRMMTSLLCAAFIIITAICLLAVTFSFSMDAAQDIAKQHAIGIASKAKSDVESLLNKPLEAVLGWQYVFSSGNHKLPSDAEAANPLWYEDYWDDYAAVMRSSGWKYQYAVFGFDDGNYIDCANVAEDEALFKCATFNWGSRNISDRTSLSARHDRFFFRSNYSIQSDEFSATNYDPRTRGWYKMVDHQPYAMQWSTVYLSVMPVLPLMDLNAAVFNASGVMMGITSLSFELGVLSDFLADLVTTDNAVSVLIDNEDLLLASSFSGEAFMSQRNIAAGDDDDTPIASNCLKSDSANSATENIILCRARITEYSYAPLRALAADEPELVKYGAEGARQIRLDGTNYFVSVLPITTDLAQGMHWRFALFVPQNDIVGDIINGRNYSIYIAIGIIVIAVVLCFAILTLLLSPLKAVTQRMYRLATLQEDSDSEEGSDNNHNNQQSILFEIATIQNAFQMMSSELTKVKSYLPQSVLAQLYGTGTDEEEEEGDVQHETSDHDGTTSGKDRSESNSNSQQFYLYQSQVSDSCESGVGGGGLYGASVNASMAATHQHKTSTAGGTAAGGGGGSSSRRQHNPQKTLNTSASLHTRRVTMLSINVCGYHNLLLGADGDTVLGLSSELVGLVARHVNEHKGVLDGFQGDRFMASFNAVTAVGYHGSAAASAALAINSAMAEGNYGAVGSGRRPPLKMSAGIATGPAIVGNMGTQGLMRFTVLGAVVTTASILERLCKRYAGCNTLVGGTAAITETQSHCELLTVDVVPLPLSPTNPSRIASLRSHAKHSAADEWMYQLEANKKESYYTEINNAFEYILRGDDVEAQKYVLSAKSRLDAQTTQAAFHHQLDPTTHTSNTATDSLSSSAETRAVHTTLHLLSQILLNNSSNNNTQNKMMKYHSVSVTTHQQQRSPVTASDNPVSSRQQQKQQQQHFIYINHLPNFYEECMVNFNGKSGGSPQIYS